jgi:hypothetical protein
VFGFYDVLKHSVCRKKILCTTDGIFGHPRCTFQTEYSVSDYIFCSAGCLKEILVVRATNLCGIIICEWRE